MELLSASLFADPGSPFCRGFVGRLFSVPEVESVTLGRARAEIRYVPGPATLSRLVRRIAGALRRDRGRPAQTAALYLTASGGAPVTVRRYGDVLSTWEIRHALPGRLRLRHSWLRGRVGGAADALVQDLTAVPGVLACRAGRYTATLLVLHDPARVGADELLALCETALHAADARRVDGPGAAEFGATGALLGLAVAGHFLSAPLLAVAASLLVAANLETFRRAWRALGARSLDTDVVYTALLAATLLSGDWLAIAVMAWSVAVWPLLLDRRLATTRRAIAGQPRRFPRLVRVRRSGREVAVPLDAVEPGDVTVVGADETVPADGVVRDGAATVDERRITGADDVTEKSSGQPVYAGSRVVSGRLTIEVTRATADGAEAEIRRRLIEAARLEPAIGATLGRRAVPPPVEPPVRRAVRGGLGITTFVLAPNYADPGLGTPLDRSATLLACADAGFLVRGEAALVRLAGVNAVVIDPGRDLREVDALVRGLRARGVGRVVVASEDAAGAAGLVRTLRGEHFSVALIGHGDDVPAAAEADVVIAAAGHDLPPVEVADVVCLSPSLPRTLDLLDHARAHQREARLSRHLGVWPTLVAAGGALALGLPALPCVLLTNVGALAVYGRGSRRLTDVEAAWRRHHG